MSSTPASVNELEILSVLTTVEEVAVTVVVAGVIRHEQALTIRLREVEVKGRKVG